MTEETAGEFKARMGRLNRSKGMDDHIGRGGWVRAFFKVAEECGENETTPIYKNCLSAVRSYILFLEKKADHFVPDKDGNDIGGKM